MKVYISHNWAARDILKNEVVPLIEAAGHTVVSRWITEPTAHDAKIESVQDIEDVRACDALILFANNYGLRPGRGKYIEFGAAIAWGKRCILVCADETYWNLCVFYSLPNVRRAPSIKEAISLI